MGALPQHVAFQLATVRYAQLGVDGGYVVLDRVRRDAHMGGYLLVGPPPVRQHGHRELGCGEVVGYAFVGLQRMKLAPAGAEAIRDGYNPLVVFGTILFRSFAAR